MIVVLFTKLVSILLLIYTIVCGILLILFITKVALKRFKPNHRHLVFIFLFWLLVFFDEFNQEFDDIFK